MQSVGSKDTAPELLVRRILHGKGYRYTLHSERLPGRPDLVFPARKIALFVHGCFWHAHSCKHGTIKSKSNVAFWSRKLAENRKRDARKRQELRTMGWLVVEVWECQLKRDTWVGRVCRVLDTRVRTSK